nr:DUF6318 family protein [Nocardioides ginsengisegetis]
MPEAAKAHTAAGAEAFVKFFWDMANYAQATGKTDGLERLAAPTCQACAAATDFVNALYAKGGHIEGGVYSLMDLESKRLYYRDHVIFRETFRTHNTDQVVFEPGKKERKFPESTVDVVFTMDFGHSGWKVGVWQVPS